MEEKDYALISDRELVDRLLIGDEEIVRYLFFDKCTPMFNYILHRFCPCQLDKNELINELYLYLQSDNWYKLRQFDFRSKLTTWLTVVAVRFFQKRKGTISSGVGRFGVKGPRPESVSPGNECNCGKFV